MTHHKPQPQPLGGFACVYAKELRLYYNTPTAYVVMVVFLLVAGYFFSTPMFLVNTASIKSFLDAAPLLMTFFIPAIAMRLFAEEFKTGTIETLLTLPLEDWQIITGKLAAALTLFMITLALTMVYPVTVSLIGDLDRGTLLCSYLGLGLTGLLLLSAGIFASALTSNQIIAFILGFTICFVFYIIGKVQLFMPPWLAPLTNYIGFDSHLDNLSRGVIDSRDLVYYLSMSALFIFLTQAKLKSTRAG